MESFYNQAKPEFSPSELKQMTTYKGTSNQLTLEPDLQTALRISRDPEVLKLVWTKWHDAAGAPQKERYAEFVDLLNEGATENGENSYLAYQLKHFFFERNCT